MLFDGVKSFEIDHTKLTPGLYVQQTLRYGELVVYIYDLRFKSPKKSEFDMDFSELNEAAIHTIEHLLAFRLRADIREINQDLKSKDILYFGPMGCKTGFYCLSTIDLTQFCGLLKLSLNKLLSSDQVIIPAVDPRLCGNFTLHDLNAAISELSNFNSVLDRQTNFNPPMLNH